MEYAYKLGYEAGKAGRQADEPVFRQALDDYHSFDRLSTPDDYALGFMDGWKGRCYKSVYIASGW